MTVATHGLGKDMWKVSFDDIDYILYVCFLPLRYIEYLGDRSNITTDLLFRRKLLPKHLTAHENIYLAILSSNLPAKVFSYRRVHRYCFERQLFNSVCGYFRLPMQTN